MGICISIFQPNICKACKVPANYYTSTEHRNRPSCRVSKTQYHTFKNDMFYSKIT